MSQLRATSPLDEVIAAPLSSIEERERRLIDAVVALARSLRDERDRLAERLREVERELSLLTSKLDNRHEATHGVTALNGSGRDVRVDRLPRPSRRRV